MRLAQSFTPITPDTTNQKQNKKHSPSFSEVTWSKEDLLQRLQNWPTDVNINWTQIANEHNIKGANRGQIVKEFAAENGFDVEKLDGRTVGTRTRRRKLRMPGREISVPTHRTAEGIKEDWTAMINEGKLTLGEPCCPSKIIRQSIKYNKDPFHELSNQVNRLTSAQKEENTLAAK